MNDSDNKEIILFSSDMLKVRFPVYQRSVAMVSYN